MPYKKPLIIAFAYIFLSDTLLLFLSLRIVRIVVTSHTIGKTINIKIIRTLNNRIPNPIDPCNFMNRVVKTSVLTFSINLSLLVFCHATYH
jgi:hypothetical protein